MLKKVLYGVGIWVIMLIISSIILIISGTSILERVLLIAVWAVGGYVAAFLFFKKAPGDLKSGLIVGGIWAAVIVILDWIMVGLANIFNQSDVTFGPAYRSWSLYLSYILFIAAAGLAGKLTHGGELMISKPVKPTASPFSKAPSQQSSSQNQNLPPRI